VVPRHRATDILDIQSLLSRKRKTIDDTLQPFFLYGTSHDPNNDLQKRKKRYEKSFESGVLDRSLTEKELPRFSVFPASSVPAFINNAPGTHYVVAQGLSDGRSAQKGRRCCDSGNTCNRSLVMARWDGNDVVPSSLSTPFYSIKSI
jgi:hypothetical protein